MKFMQNISRSLKLGIFFIFVILLLGGCASTGSLHVITPTTVKLADYKTLLFHASSQVPESGEEVIQLESITIAKLRENGLFDKVVAGSASPDAPADLQLNAKIVELKKVGAGARVMLGALAGRAGIVVDVELIDMKAGKIIGAFKAEGKSSGGTVFAGTTSQAIERAAEQIVEFLHKSL